MAVKEVLNHINNRAGVSNYHNIPLDKWIKCQKASISNFVNLDSNINLDNDVDFQNFYDFLSSTFFESKIKLTTAKKIFNNAYFVI